MLKKLSAGFAVFIAVVFIGSSVALAHVTVKPAEVKTAERQVFSVGVPNESEKAQVVGVRLIIPQSLESVRPNSKPGWKIEIKKTGKGETAKVTELIWTGGSVPVGQRDEFLFQAKVPEATGELQWKAYETYSDGTVVAWEEEPSEKEDSKPYSTTKIINTPSVEPDTNSPSDAEQQSDNKTNIAIGLSILATVLSASAIYTKRK